MAPNFAPETAQNNDISLLARALIALVRLYQMTFSRLLPEGVCIYEPTCSRYMIAAIATHGVWRGVLLGIWRICRCHPLARGGYDPVPQRGAPFLTMWQRQPFASEKHG